MPRHQDNSHNDSSHNDSSDHNSSGENSSGENSSAENSSGQNSSHDDSSHNDSWSYEQPSFGGSSFGTFPYQPTDGAADQAPADPWQADDERTTGWAAAPDPSAQPSLFPTDAFGGYHASDPPADGAGYPAGAGADLDETSGPAVNRRIVASRRFRVTASVVGLALLLAGAAAVTFRHDSTTGQAAASREDDRASRDEVRAAASLAAGATDTPGATASATSAPTTTPPAATTPPAVVTTPPKPAATTKKATPKAAAPPPAASAGCANYSGNRLIACNMLPSFGFDTSEMAALDPMWENESGWNDQAENSSSGAFGIPQALPGSKMASAGSDWQTNPATQIAWGLGYIKDRYGSPSAAWSFWQSNGWY